MNGGKRSFLLILVVSISLTLQACSVEQIMQAAGGLLMGLSTQIQNPALQQLVQAIGQGLASNPQGFDQFLQNTAATLATNYAGMAFPPGVGQAVGSYGQTGTSYPGAPTNVASGLSSYSQQVLSQLQARGLAATEQNVRAVANEVFAGMQDPPKSQIVNTAVTEIMRLVQQQAANQSQAPSTSNPTVPTSSQGAVGQGAPPPITASGSGNPSGPITYNPNGQQTGYPQTGGYPPPPPPNSSGGQGGVSIGFNVPIGPVTIGGQVNIPIGGQK